MCLSQPAISKNLKRLREHFDDELFIRQQYGLEPTPFAKGLLVMLPHAIHAVESVLYHGRFFAPEQYTSPVTIAINASLYRAMSKTLMKGLMSKLPNASLKFLTWGLDTEANLLNGSIDLGINYHPLELSSALEQKQIGHIPFKLCCHKDHPLTKGTHGFIDIVGYPLALSWMPDFIDTESIMERMIRQLGATPNVRLRADQLNICFNYLAEGEAIMPVVDLQDIDLPEDLTLVGLKEKNLGSYIGLTYNSRSAGHSMIQWLLHETELLLQTRHNLR